MVEIIPKPTKRILPWQNALFYLSLALVIAVVFGYFILLYFENKASGASRNLEEKIAEVGTPEEKAREIEVFAQKRKIEDFSKLLQGHQKSSNFLKFLEGITHPKVWFSRVELNIDQFQAQLSGRTQSFQTLGQQLFIFQRQNLIQNVDLAKLSLGKTGEAEFSFLLSFDPELLKEK